MKTINKLAFLVSFLALVIGTDAIWPWIVTITISAMNMCGDEE